MRQIAFLWLALVCGVASGQVEGPLLDRLADRIETQRKSIDEMESKIKIVDKLFGRCDLADRERSTLRESIGDLLSSRQEMLMEQKRLNGVFSNVRENLKAAKAEREIARAERETVLERLAEWRNSRPTLASRLFWFSMSVLFSAAVAIALLLGFVAIVNKYFPGIRRLFFGVQLSFGGRIGQMVTKGIYTVLCLTLLATQPPVSMSMHPIWLFVASTGMSMFASQASLWRTPEPITARNVISHLLNLGTCGAALSMIAYAVIGPRANLEWYILGGVGLFSLGGMAAIDVVVSLGGKILARFTGEAHE